MGGSGLRGFPQIRQIVCSIVRGDGSVRSTDCVEVFDELRYSLAFQKGFCVMHIIISLTNKKLFI